MNKTLSASESSSRTQTLIWPALFFLLIVINAAAFSWNPLMGGDDFWGHAAIGRWAIENRAVPRESLFLWTAHIPWIYHSYGAGVLFAALLNLGGPFLALLFNAFASALPFALIYSWWRRHRPFATVFSLFIILAIWVSSARWHLRPEMFTVNFLALIFLFFLSQKRPLWLCGLMVAMFALWPNLHGGCLMGIIVMWGTGVAELIEDRKKGFNTLALAAICTLAVFVGSAYHFTYIQTWRDIGSYLYQAVDEWKPFWKKPYLPPEVVISIFLVWGTALYLWFKSPERKLAHLVWLLLFGLSFLQYRRQMWQVSVASITVLAIYAAPLRGQNLFGWYSRMMKRSFAANDIVPSGFSRIARVGTLVILLCSLVAALSREKTPFAVYDSKFPHGMASYLETEAPPGRMFNDYEYSASLQWLLYGKREFYIDLINAYPQDLLREYFEVISASIKGRQILDKRKIDIVALRPRKKGELMIQLANSLNNDPRWRRVYDDKDGTVWVRISALKNRNLAQLYSLPQA